MEKIEAKYVVGNEGGVVDDSVAKRVSSEVAPVNESRPLLQVRPLQRSRSLQQAKPLPQLRPLHQLSISVIENSQGVSDVVEKEKRTHKANQFYRN